MKEGGHDGINVSSRNDQIEGVYEKNEALPRRDLVVHSTSVQVGRNPRHLENLYDYILICSFFWARMFEISKRFSIYTDHFYACAPQTSVGLLMRISEQAYGEGPNDLQ